MALTDNLVSWWSLDEAGGPRADSHGANTLTDNNTVTSAAGVRNSGALFTRANSEYLSVANNATLPDPQSGSFTVAFWYKATTDNAATYIGRYVNAFSPGWEVWENNNTIQFRIVQSGGGSIGCSASTFNLAQTGVWRLVIASYDAVTGGMECHMLASDVADWVSATNTVTPYAGANTLPLEIGGDNSGYFDGVMDEVAIWSRVLTAGDRDELWNAGAGRDYSGIVIPRYEETGGLLVIEGEHFESMRAGVNGTTWAVESIAEASGGEATYGNINSTAYRTTYKTNGPRADYPIRINTAGTYYVWMRGRSNGEGNSRVRFGVNQTQIIGSSYGAPHPSEWSETVLQWTEIDSASVRLQLDFAEAGDYTLNMWNLMMIPTIDKIVLTNSAAYNPSSINGGLGPDESLTTGAGDTTPPAAPTSLVASTFTF